MVLWLYICLALLLNSYQLESRSLGYSSLNSLNPDSDFYGQLQELLGDHGIQNTGYPDSKEVFLQEVNEWPKASISSHFKQAAAIHSDDDGKVHVFHRGPNVWDENSFDFENNYLQADKGPIPNDTVLVLDAKTGDLISSWGKNKFYMPHGLTIDKDGNSWLTDVALHMVMKFPPGQEEPSLKLGMRMMPGSDNNHFCKPTDVAVASNGDFFVSDGYCNSRIVKFNSTGQVQEIIGLEDSLLVPHGLSLDERQDQLCVADRENFRVVCYSAGVRGDRPLGDKLFTIQPPYMGRVFAVKHAGNQLIAVTGSGEDSIVPAEATLVLNIPQQKLVETFRPQFGFKMPHALSISPDQTSLFIVDSDVDAPKKIYKLNINSK